jgi:hypothetical protein
MDTQAVHNIATKSGNIYVRTTLHARELSGSLQSVTLPHNFLPVDHCKLSEGAGREGNYSARKPCACSDETLNVSEPLPVLADLAKFSQFPPRPRF